MEIDAGRQEAAVATLEAQRGSREADLAYSRQQAARLKTLLDAGAVSQQEFEQADATVKRARRSWRRSTSRFASSRSSSATTA